MCVSVHGLKFSHTNMSQGQELKARELAQYDDVATSVCVDPSVGFTTHKMNPRFRHVKGRFGKLRGVLESYARDGNVERAYESLVSGNWARTFLMGKPKQSILAFKKHVRPVFKSDVCSDLDSLLS